MLIAIVATLISPCLACLKISGSYGKDINNNSIRKFADMKLTDNGVDVLHQAMSVLRGEVTPVFLNRDNGWMAYIINEKSGEIGVSRPGVDAVLKVSSTFQVQENIEQYNLEGSAWC